MAAALDQEMVLHQEMADLLREKMNDTNNKDGELTEAQVKMAMLPSRSKLRYLSDDESDWPVLQCRNVFILPGVPAFFEKKVADVAAYLSSAEVTRSVVYKVGKADENAKLLNLYVLKLKMLIFTIFMKLAVLSVDETTIVPILNRVVEEHPEVSFGSYPFVSHPEFKTVLTLEGRMESKNDVGSVDEPRLSFTKQQMDHHVQLALDYLLTKLPAGSVLRVDDDDTLP